MSDMTKQNTAPQLQIARLRRERGATQEDLANHLGVTCQAVSKWETGGACPDVALLPAIAGYFGTSVDAVLGCAAEPTVDALPAAVRSALAICPDDLRYRAAWELCCLLHEAVVTDGWHKAVPWDTSKPPQAHRYDHWGLSADTRQEGYTMLTDGVLTMGLRAAASADRPQTSRRMARFFQRLGRPGVLEVLTALCAAQDDGDEPVLLPVDDVAKSAALEPEACLKVLQELDGCDWVRLSDGEHSCCAMTRRLDALLLPVLALVHGFERLI